MIYMALILGIVAVCFVSAFASRNETVAGMFDGAATFCARSIGTIFGVALAVVVLALYLATTPIGRVIAAFSSN